jgi:predicted DCC family thiol-disulfide oxidoreductase YuxK
MKKSPPASPSSTRQPSHDGARVSVPYPVLFFDGRCGLCRSSVRWLIGNIRSSEHGLWLAPLQGTTANLLGVNAEEQSVVLWDGQQFLREDHAVIAALEATGRVKTARLLRAIPQQLRGWAYRFIAARRSRSIPADCPLDLGRGPLLP